MNEVLVRYRWVKSPNINLHLQGSISAWLQRQMGCVCVSAWAQQAERPAAGVHVHLPLCEVKKNEEESVGAGNTLCTNAASRRPLLCQNSESFFVSNLASATLRSFTLLLPFTYLYPLPHPLTTQQQYTHFFLFSVSREEETPQRCTWLTTLHAQPDEHVDKNREEAALLVQPSDMSKRL